VETFNKVLKAVKSLNDELIKKTISVAQGYGIPSEYIQTDYINIQPVYEHGDPALTLLGYVVRKIVVVRLKDLSKFEEVLSDALEAGVTHVHGIEFLTTELRKYRDQARTLALKAAREKAELLAKEAGLQIGKVLSVGEASFGYWSSYAPWWGQSQRYGGMSQNVTQNLGGVSMDRDGSLAPGHISIRATIGASFALE
jgi:uncharacterized protein YggE